MRKSFPSSKRKVTLLAATLLSLGVLMSGCDSVSEMDILPDTTETTAASSETTVASTEAATTEQQTTQATTQASTQQATTPVSTEPTTKAPAQPTIYGNIDFSTVDLDGNPVNYSDFSSATVIMLNMWEPWCGPCVSEMPDLETLYQNYKDQGLIILGFHNSDEEFMFYAEEIVEETGVTYPILHYDNNIQALSTGYVPTTYFLDGNGHIISDSYIGSRSYSEWESILLNYLN